MIEMRRLKNVVIFIQTILSYVLSRTISTFYSAKNSITYIAMLWKFAFQEIPRFFLFKQSCRLTVLEIATSLKTNSYSNFWKMFWKFQKKNQKLLVKALYGVRFCELQIYKPQRSILHFSEILENIWDSAYYRVFMVSWSFLQK